MWESQVEVFRTMLRTVPSHEYQGEDARWVLFCLVDFFEDRVRLYTSNTLERDCRFKRLWLQLEQSLMACERRYKALLPSSCSALEALEGRDKLDMGARKELDSALSKALVAKAAVSALRGELNKVQFEERLRENQVTEAEFSQAHARKAAVAAARKAAKLEKRRRAAAEGNVVPTAVLLRQGVSLSTERSTLQRRLRSSRKSQAQRRQPPLQSDVVAWRRLLGPGPSEATPPRRRLRAFRRRATPPPTEASAPKRRRPHKRGTRRGRFAAERKKKVEAHIDLLAQLKIRALERRRFKRENYLRLPRVRGSVVKPPAEDSSAEDEEAAAEEAKVKVVAPARDDAAAAEDAGGWSVIAAPLSSQRRKGRTSSRRRRGSKEWAKQAKTKTSDFQRVSPFFSTFYDPRRREEVEGGGGEIWEADG